MKQLLVAILIACSAGAVIEARAERAVNTATPVLLVAQASLVDKLYSKTVLFTKPIGGDRHVGFILNKPTPQTLGTLFPNEAAASRVNAPVYLGGPVNSEAIFALVKGKDSPGASSIPMLDDLWLAVESEVIDAVIEKHGKDARYFAGMVLWKPGELASEMKRGLWHVLEPKSDYVFHKNVETMWDGLSLRGSMLQVDGPVTPPTNFMRVSTETIMKPIMPAPAPIKRGAIDKPTLPPTDGGGGVIVPTNAQPQVESRNAAWVQLFTETLHAEARMRGEDPGVWTITDTGDSTLDPNGVEWPLVKITKQGQPNECLIAIGPEGWTNIACIPLEWGGVKRLLN